MRLSGWWYTYPPEKYEFVSWDDYSQYMENNPNVPNHQPDNMFCPLDIPSQKARPIQAPKSS